MESIQRINQLRDGYASLIERLDKVRMQKLSEQVDTKKLEEAYEKISSEYVLVFKRKDL